MTKFPPQISKKWLFEAFGKKISQLALDIRDGHCVVRGKWAIVEPVGDKWDIWLCNPDNLASGLTTRKLNNMLRVIRGVLDEPITQLDGEAWLRVDSVDKVLAITKVCGIRRKKRLSAAQLKVLRDNSL